MTGVSTMREEGNGNFGALGQPEGWGGEGGGGGGSGWGGTHVFLWLIHVDVRQKPSQHCKVIIFQLN